MTAYAHTREGSPPSSWEPLSVHLDKVSQLAANFADAFGARLWGDVLGWCHDLGKFSNEFQSYLHDAGMKSVDAGAEDDADTHTPGKRVDHSTFGARFVEKYVGESAGQLLAFCIAGHHTGLPDETSTDDLGGRSTLRYKLNATQYPIAHAEAPGIELPKLKLTPPPVDACTASKGLPHDLCRQLRRGGDAAQRNDDPMGDEDRAQAETDTRFR
jgi:CRISPR-associated endonuclease/helicase Cas3